MQVQVARGSTRKHALDEARRAYGPDPLVLSVRRRTSSDDDFEWEALVARETPESNSDEAPAKPTPISQLPLPDEPSAIRTLHRDLATIVARAASPDRGSLDELLDLARRIARLEHDVCASLLSAGEVGRAWLPFLDRLDKSGYPKGDAVQLIRSIDQAPVFGAELSDWTHYYRRLRRALSESFEVAPTAERVRPGLAVFVGASGVGKTTLAAKLAADLALGGGTAPVLGAVRPRPGLGLVALKRCAETLGVEFVEVASRDELRGLEERATEGPVVLDTPSISPFDDRALRQLGEVIDGAANKEIHTVVPSTHSTRDFAQALSAFGTIGANRLAVTHLDEAPFVGRVIAAAKRAETPISYLSQGSRIPDDLVRPGAEALLDAVLRPERTTTK